MSDQDKKATLLTRKQVYPGRVVKLDVERLALPDGRTIELEILRHPGASAVVPIDEKGNAILIRQYRHAAGGWIWEIPAGKLENSEAPESCALREVEEEVGYRAERLISLGWIWTTPGFTDEKIWLYAATGLTATDQSLDADEWLEVVPLPVAEAVDMAARGDIEDSKSAIALLRLARFLDMTSFQPLVSQD